MIITTLKRFGLLNVVLFITLIIVLFTIASGSLIVYLFQGYVDILTIIIAIVISSTVVPYPLTILFKVLLKLDKTEKELLVKNEELEEMSITDALTTLYNRRYFDEIFSKQINIVKRSHRVLAFAMIDIDYFKAYNDEYGHQAGDKVIKFVSLSFKEAFARSDDYVFRLGGEEFGFLFHSDDKNSAIEFVEKIRKDVEKLKINHIGNKISSYVTVSIGLYLMGLNDKNDFETIYKVCDDALYTAKARGRNRVHRVQGE